MDPSSLAMGWWPPATSMMESRRVARPAGPSIHIPPSSGPRWRRVSRIRTSRPSSTASCGCTLTIPAMPHISVSSRSSGDSPRLRPRQHAPHPEVVDQTTPVFRDDEHHKDLGTLRERQPIRRPRRRVLIKHWLTRQVRERRELCSVQRVVLWRTEVEAVPVPAPPILVIPDRQPAHQSVNAVLEELVDSAVPRLCEDIVETKKTEDKAIKHPRGRDARVLLVEDASIVDRSDAPGGNVLFEDHAGITRQVAEPTVLRQPVGADQRAHRQPLAHRGDPRRREAAGPLDVVERIMPDDATVGPPHGMGSQPWGLGEERLPHRPPQRLEPSRPAPHAHDHRFSTNQFPIARYRSPERSKTSKASSGLLTMGKP